jgi:hypothetical protein
MTSRYEHRGSRSSGQAAIPWREIGIAVAAALLVAALVWGILRAMGETPVVDPAVAPLVPAAEIADNPVRYADQLVAVEGTIVEAYSPSSFLLDVLEAGEDVTGIVVFGAAAVPDPGTEVSVEGRVRVLDAQLADDPRLEGVDVAALDGAAAIEADDVY